MSRRPCPTCRTVPACACSPSTAARALQARGWASLDPDQQQARVAAMLAGRPEIDWRRYPLRTARLWRARLTCRLCAFPVEPGQQYRDAGRDKAHAGCVNLDGGGEVGMELNTVAGWRTGDKRAMELGPATVCCWCRQGQAFTVETRRVQVDLGVYRHWANVTCRHCGTKHTWMW